MGAKPQPIEIRRFKHHEGLWRAGTAQRNEKIATEHNMGLSISTLAKKYKLSRPRIVQIINLVKFWSEQNAG